MSSYGGRGGIAPEDRCPGSKQRPMVTGDGGRWGACPVCGRHSALWPKHRGRIDEKVVWIHRAARLDPPTKPAEPPLRVIVEGQRKRWVLQCVGLYLLVLLAAWYFDLWRGAL